MLELTTQLAASVTLSTCIWLKNHQLQKGKLYMIKFPHFQGRLAASTSDNHRPDKGVNKDQHKIIRMINVQAFDYDVGGKWHHVHSLLS